MANIEIKSEEMNVLLQAAILEALGEVGQKELIEQSIKYLTTPAGYKDPKTTPIQDILYNTAATVARSVIEEKLKSNEEFEAEITKVFNEAFEQVFVINREKVK